MQNQHGFAAISVACWLKSLCHIPGVVSLGHMSLLVSVISFGGTSTLIFTGLHKFTLEPTVIKGSPYPMSSPGFVDICVLLIVFWRRWDISSEQFLTVSHICIMIIVTFYQLLLSSFHLNPSFFSYVSNIYIVEYYDLPQHPLTVSITQERMRSRGYLFCTLWKAEWPNFVNTEWFNLCKYLL